MEFVIDRFNAYLKTVARISPRCAASFEAGLTPDETSDLIANMGFTTPQAVIDVLTVRNGQAGVLGGLFFYDGKGSLTRYVEPMARRHARGPADRTETLRRL
ncbi:hypothetical protein, partial [Deinococcus malanensis]|uniref:hypothetical protein n=1 Tax=Deinococcus malanensis TaxID=1706855 RepID=UPI001E4A9CFB